MGYSVEYFPVSSFTIFHTAFTLLYDSNIYCNAYL
jgi:hypothetical protein